MLSFKTSFVSKFANQFYVFKFTNVKYLSSFILSSSTLKILNSFLIVYSDFVDSYLKVLTKLRQSEKT